MRPRAVAEKGPWPRGPPRAVPARPSVPTCPQPHLNLRCSRPPGVLPMCPQPGRTGPRARASRFCCLSSCWAVPPWARSQGESRTPRARPRLCAGPGRTGNTVGATGSSGGSCDSERSHARDETEVAVHTCAGVRGSPGGGEDGSPRGGHLCSRDATCPELISVSPITSTKEFLYHLVSRREH